MLVNGGSATDTGTWGSFVFLGQRAIVLQIPKSPNEPFPDFYTAYNDSIKTDPSSTRLTLVRRSSFPGSSSATTYEAVCVKAQAMTAAQAQQLTAANLKNNPLRPEAAAQRQEQQQIQRPPAESARESLKPSNPFAVKVHQYSDAIVSIDPRSIEIKGGLLDLILTYDFDKPTPNLFGTNLTAQHVQMHTQYDCRKRVSTMLRITATTPAGKGISYVEFNPGWSPANPGDGLFNEVCARAPRIYNDYVELHNNSTCVGACDAMRRNEAILDHVTAQRCRALKPVASPLELSRAGCL
jgi:hypothetical protein